VEKCAREAEKLSKPKKRCYRKRVDFYLLVNIIKLWPSRSGILHGIRKIAKKGSYAEITTHCGYTFLVRLSKNSRAARWLRNKWFFKECCRCRIPSWKLEKFASTKFAQHYGSTLEETNTKACK
jgi:pyrrolysyl-tRNA synthetase-like protein